MEKREKVPFNLGIANEIAFLFSCPGKIECENKLVVYGKTGENLETFISFIEDVIKENLSDEKFVLWQDFKEKNPKCSRYFFTITNSSDEVYYKGYIDKRTEPLISKIKDKENIGRLVNELKNSKLIVGFGKRAETILNSLNNYEDTKNIKKKSTRHLGLQSLNQIKIDKDISGKDRTKARIQSLATRITK